VPTTEFALPPQHVKHADGHVSGRLQELAHKYLGPIRNRKELEAFLTSLEEAKTNDLPRLSPTSKSRIYNKEWIDALEFRAIVHLLEAAARSALARTESRGVHFRQDYPKTDNDNWLFESIVRIANGGMEIAKRPVTVTSITPPGGKAPFLEMMKRMMQAHSDVGGHH